MQIIQSPNIPDQLNDPIVFMAGGITNCPDWQDEMTQKLSSSNRITREFILVNPRRLGDHEWTPTISNEQIEWEHRFIKQAALVTFWFPKETLCPITLYELGMCAALGKKIIVGCHAGYERIFDVTKQLQLIRPEVVVNYSLDDVIDGVLTDMAMI